MFEPYINKLTYIITGKVKLIINKLSFVVLFVSHTTNSSILYTR